MPRTATLGDYPSFQLSRPGPALVPFALRAARRLPSKDDQLFHVGEDRNGAS
jgi:hypothetical protein